MTAPSRVRDLDLRIRIDGGWAETERPALTAAVQDDLVPGVLDALERLVHRRFGQEVVLRIRELRVRWGVAGHEVASPSHAEALAAEVLDQIERNAGGGTSPAELLPPVDASVVFYQNRAHQRAAWLTGRLGGGRPAWHAEGAFDDDEGWAALGPSDGAELRRIVEYLDRMGALEGVAEEIPSSDAQRLHRLVPLETWPLDRLPPTLREVAGEEPPAPADLRDPAGAGGEAAGGGARTEPGGEPPPDHAGTPGAAPQEGASGKTGGPGRGLEGELYAGPSGTGEAGPHYAPGVDTLPEAGPEAGPKTVPRSTPSVPRSGRVDPGGPGGTDASPTHPRTRFAGLFYLLNPILELELAEHLWCAGVREGHLLCHVARALVDPPDARDPAPRVLGGVDGPADPELAAMKEWAGEEVREKSLEALEALLSRVRSGDPPANLAGEVDGRARAMAPRVAPGVPPGPASRTVAACAALLWRAFEARLGRELELEALGALLRVQATLHWKPDELRVVMPMEAIDIAVRRAGLDRNPGWVPWLEANVVLEFEEEEGAPPTTAPDST